MTQYDCPECRSAQNVGANPTNHAVLHYCSTCDHPFDPPEWSCPNCETTTDAPRSPFDDPWSYYCYECDTAFNRLEPTFERDIVSAPDGEAIDMGSMRLALAAEKGTASSKGTRQYRITLRNVGPTMARTRGERPIAIQHRVTDDRWWTIYGNPARFDSGQNTHLQPEQTLCWTLTIGPRDISGQAFAISRDALPSGEYRVVYWGLPEADVLPAVTLSVEFDDTLHGW